MSAVSWRWNDNSFYCSMLNWMFRKINLLAASVQGTWAGRGKAGGSSLSPEGLVSILFPGLHARHLSFDCCQSFLKFAGFSTDEFISRFRPYFMEKTLEEGEAVKNTAVPLSTRMELCQGTWSLIRQWRKSLKAKPGPPTAAISPYF